MSDAAENAAAMIEAEAGILLDRFALSEAYRPALEGLLETYSPDEITGEHIDAMMELA